MNRVPLYGRLPEIYRINADGSGIRLLSRAQPVLETRFLVVPDPVAGARYTVTLGVATGTGAAVGRGKTSCSARVGAMRLRVVASSFRASRARCAWFVPNSARGKWLYITIRAKAKTSVLTEEVRTRVR